MSGPIPGVDTGGAVESIAHVIQVALTPVFLLSGIGTLLGVFNTRLTRVSDHTENATDLLDNEADEGKARLLVAHLRRLQQRRLALDTSVVLGALGGASTCCAAFVLFLGGLREAAIASWLFILFGMALGCTVGALMAFLLDSVLAWHGLRREGPMPRPKNPA
jgi:hypothetical protein